MPATSLEFKHYFEQVDDPRMARTRLHELIDILFLCVAATIAGCDGPAEIEDFAHDELDWCRKFVPLKNGVPSHDTIGRVISLIKPDQFQKAFTEWIHSHMQSIEANGPQFVPIDGKTMRGSAGPDRENPLHVVSAWASQHGMTLGQVACDDKSNEITAIPLLLEMLDLKGAIISIDAMGCQTEIAKQITEAAGDYTLAVKGNQPTLHNAIKKFFEERHENGDYSKHRCRQKTNKQKARGGTETRYYIVAPIPKDLNPFTASWSGLTSIGQVITTVQNSEGKETSEVRYFISSRPAKVTEFSTSVRNHWSIESMHWILDVVFLEDKSKLRNADSPENFTFLRKFVIGLLKRDTSKLSLRRKRKRAARNSEFLENILFA